MLVKRLDELDRRFAVIRHGEFAREAVLFEGLADEIGIGGIVFDEQNGSQVRPAAGPVRLVSCGDRKEKRRTLAWFGFDPDSSPGALDDPFANSEPHAGAGIDGDAMKAFEEAKDLLLVLGLNADAVILNRKEPVAILAVRRDMYPRRSASLRYRMALPTRFWKSCSI